MITFLNDYLYRASIKHDHAFGLSVMKTDDWHVTLRHHAYTKKQPSGHFHNDVASITLAYKGVPILVDPGSFVYTPSSYWRNYFRSVAVHNTFFIEGEEPVPFSERLFALDLPAKKADPVSVEASLFTEHALYQGLGLQAQRIVTYDQSSSTIKITDSWVQHQKMQEQVSVWNFTFATGITLKKQSHKWLVCYQGKQLLVLISDDVIFESMQGWVYGAYGLKEQTMMLRAKRKIAYDTQIFIQFVP